MNKYKVSYTQDNGIVEKFILAEGFCTDHNSNLAFFVGGEQVALFNYYNHVIKEEVEVVNGG